MKSLKNQQVSFLLCIESRRQDQGTSSVSGIFLAWNDLNGSNDGISFSCLPQTPWSLLQAPVVITACLLLDKTLCQEQLKGERACLVSVPVHHQLLQAPAVLASLP